MKKSFSLTIRVVWWMWIFQALFGLACTVGMLSSLKSVFQGSTNSLLVFFAAAFFAYIGWANALSTIRVTDESVSVTVFHGCYLIKWDEVQKVIQQGYLIALIGNDKRVVLAVQLMGKASRDKLFDYFSQQIEERKINFSPTDQVPLTHHNTRAPLSEMLRNFIS